eukprot:3939740-Rhodomonas_salina.1
MLVSLRHLRRCSWLLCSGLAHSLYAWPSRGAKKPGGDAAAHARHSPSDHATRPCFLSFLHSFFVPQWGL